MVDVVDGKKKDKDRGFNQTSGLFYFQKCLPLLSYSMNFLHQFILFSYESWYLFIRVIEKTIYKDFPDSIF